MYLLDTNILLEVLLGQPKSTIVKQFMNTTSPDQLALTDFAVYSIGIKLIRIGKANLYRNMINDLLVKNAIRVVRLQGHEILAAIDATQGLKLDFDDAYQYTAAEKYDLTLVSFDTHFDTTPRGRKTPADLLTSS